MRIMQNIAHIGFLVESVQGQMRCARYKTIGIYHGQMGLLAHPK